MNESAQQQLAALDLSIFFGVASDDPTFQESATQLAEMIWSNFLNEEVPYLLPDENSDELADLMSKEDVTQDEIMDFFRRAIEDFDTIYKKYVLKNKAETIRGRIAELQHEYEGDEEKLNCLSEIEELALAEEWQRVAELFQAEFANEEAE